MTTVGTLRTDVGEFLARTTAVTAAFSTIVRLAESLIARTVRVRAMETNTTLTATAATVSLPTNFISAIQISNNDTSNPKLRLVPPDVLVNTSYPDDSGSPALVAIEANTLRIAPPATASASASINMLYFARFDALDVNDADDTNWLLANAYDIYFAACMHIAGLRFRDLEIADRYQLMFQQKVDELHEQENLARISGGPRSVWREVPPGGA